MSWPLADAHMKGCQVSAKITPQLQLKNYTKNYESCPKCLGIGTAEQLQSLLKTKFVNIIRIGNSPNTALLQSLFVFPVETNI